LFYHIIYLIIALREAQN